MYVLPLVALLFAPAIFAEESSVTRARSSNRIMRDEYQNSDFLSRSTMQSPISSVRYQSRITPLISPSPATMRTEQTRGRESIDRDKARKLLTVIALGALRSSRHP